MIEKGKWTVVVEVKETLKLVSEILAKHDRYINIKMCGVYSKHKTRSFTN